ncbi:MAG: hypothetical protein K6348_09125 [Deferribacterales bacterium]
MFKKLFFVFAILAILVTGSFASSIRVTSLPNPNLFTIFIIAEKGYAPVEFVPAVGDVSTMVGLFRGNKADIMAVNFEVAEKLTKEMGLTYYGSTISRAIHIVTKLPIGNKKELEGKKIVASFRGGSPDIIFRKLEINNSPIFTDLQVAIQMFINQDYDVILLPEPHVSNVYLKMKNSGKEVYTYDLLELSGKNYKYPINAFVGKPEFTKIFKNAMKKSVDFINSNPQEAANIFEKYYKIYYKSDFPFAAIKEAVISKRLKFEYDE